MRLDVVNALASAVTAVGTSWSRGQEWLSCARVLWNRPHYPQPHRASFANGAVVKEQCALLQIRRLRGYLEQLAFMGGYSRFSRN
jgi:hypothetical protein